MTEEERLRAKIKQTERELTKLKEELSQISVRDETSEQHIGKCFVQDMYETGVRFMIVTDAKYVYKELNLCAYGAVWDEQNQRLDIISSDDAQWFENCNYGTLIEHTREELENEIKERLSLILENYWNE